MEASFVVKQLPVGRRKSDMRYYNLSILIGCVHRCDHLTWDVHDPRLRGRTEVSYGYSQADTAHLLGLFDCVRHTTGGDRNRHEVHHRLQALHIGPRVPLLPCYQGLAQRIHVDFCAVLDSNISKADVCQVVSISIEIR